MMNSISVNPLRLFQVGEEINLFVFWLLKYLAVVVVDYYMMITFSEDFFREDSHFLTSQSWPAVHESTHRKVSSFYKRINYNKVY